MNTYFFKSYLLSVFSCVSLISVTVNSAPVINYGEDLTALKQQFSNGQLHILQIGDSHTAGDYFTEQLRKRLQTQLGDGGIGFAPPMKVSGQRVARHGYQAFGWSLLNSRVDDALFPLGGFIAQPISADNLLTLTSEYYHNMPMQATFMVRSHGGALSFDGVTVPINTQGQWQVIQRNIQFPVSIHSKNHVDIGGVWLTQLGAMVSSMGINGSQLKHWQRWHDISRHLHTSHANLVILAYGTNEAFSKDVSDQTDYLISAIKKIRQGLPSATILIMGAPESLKSKRGTCGKRPANLDAVQLNLIDIAQTEKTLYWSWEEAMGGACSMKKWIKRGLAAHDGVHFTRTGYEKAANNLFDNLLPLLTQSSQATENFKFQTYTDKPNIDNQMNSQTNIGGFGKICNQQGHCVSLGK